VKPWAVAMAVAIELVLRGVALAADPRFPDWPCNQVKVPEISVAAVWAGPAIDDVGNAWGEDAATKDLVARLRRAARRSWTRRWRFQISITGTESERQKKAKLLFAGLFKSLNDERSEVMHGIERYFRKQKQSRRADESSRMGHTRLRGAPQDDKLRLRSACCHRATAVCACPCDPAIARVRGRSADQGLAILGSNLR
jgi:hypothetical protein